MFLTLQQQSQTQARLGIGVHSFAVIAGGKVVEPLAVGIDTFIEAPLGEGT